MSRSEKWGVAPNTADVWVIVPVFNEASVLKDVLSELTQEFQNVVCVDDGSVDTSAEVAMSAGATVLRHVVNLGQGAALQTGLDFAIMQGGRYFVTFDSDGQHSVKNAKEMLSRITSEPVDVILGSRFLDSVTKPGRLKVAVLKMAVLFERITTGVRLTDAHNGLRVLNLQAAKTIRIHQNRMAHASDIISQIGKTKLRYVEHPVQIHYTQYSKTKGQSVWNSVNIVMDLFIR